jgi:anti-sigma regulatory factor (Ser/Thr protein kinase)
MEGVRAGCAGDGLVWRQAFVGRGDQAAPARHLVRLLLRDTVRAEDAEWVAAELASNALHHTKSGARGGFFVVEVARTASVARVTVYDLGGGAVPDFDRAVAAARRAELDLSESGRGLAGAAALADRVGAAGDPVCGHAVWAEFSLVSGGAEPRQRVGRDTSGRDQGSDEHSQGVVMATSAGGANGLDPSIALRRAS